MEWNAKCNCCCQLQVKLLRVPPVLLYISLQKLYEKVQHCQHAPISKHRKLTVASVTFMHGTVASHQLLNNSRGWIQGNEETPIQGRTMIPGQGSMPAILDLLKQPQRPILLIEQCQLHELVVTMYIHCSIPPFHSIFQSSNQRHPTSSKAF